MGTTNITITDTYQDADDQNLLNLVNAISLKLNGVNASNDGTSRPSKAEIISIINETQKDICNENDFTFLYKTAVVNGFTSTNSDQTKESYSGSVGQQSSMGTSVSQSVVDYYAEKLTSDSDVVSVPSKVSLYLGRSNTGFGLIQATLTALICPIASGVPDVSNPAASSDLIAVVDSVTDGGTSLPSSAVTEIEFTFSDSDEILEASTNYYIVLKVSYAATNGDGVYLGGGGTGGTTTKVLNDSNSRTWTDISAAQIYYNLTYDSGAYTTELTLPVDADKIYRIYEGTVDDPDSNMREYMSTKYMYNPQGQPIDSFVIRRYTSTGFPVVKVKSSKQNVSQWTVEYKKKASVLSADTDIPLIPSNFRGLLIKKPLYDFRADNLGTTDVTEGQLNRLMGEYERALLRLQEIYIPKYVESMTVSRGGETPCSEAFYSEKPNRFEINI